LVAGREHRKREKDSTVRQTSATNKNMQKLCKKGPNAVTSTKGSCENQVARGEGGREGSS